MAADAFVWALGLAVWIRLIDMGEAWLHPPIAAFCGARLGCTHVRPAAPVFPAALAPHRLRCPCAPQGALCDDDAGVRTAAGGVFNVLFKSGGGSAMDSVIPALLGGLDSEAHSAQVGAVGVGAAGGRKGAAEGCWGPCMAACPGGPALPTALHAPLHMALLQCPLPCPLLCATQALEGLRVVLGVRPQLLSVMVPRLIKPPVTSTNLRALGALAEVAGALRCALYAVCCGRACTALGRGHHAVVALDLPLAPFQEAPTHGCC